MCDPARMNIYRQIWEQVHQKYNSGHIVSERGLQAVLHGALQAHLPSVGVHVVVEPTWTMVNGKKKTPDLVIVEGGEITDIFEIKFVPHNYAKWRKDIKKLRSYVGNPRAQYPVSLDPQTGKWDKCLPVQKGCCLHFVAVARHDAEAVWPPLPGATGIKHWFGRVGGAGGWDIHCA